jgi:hypothetical protein
MAIIDMERLAFKHFALAYPHEAYEAFPDDFWALFHERYPDATRETMEALLAERMVRQ